MRPDPDPQATIDDLLELYAIDALEPREMDLFESALSALPGFQRERAVEEIRRTRDAVGRMAAECSTVPSVAVRARILDAIDTDCTRRPLRSVTDGARISASASAELPWSDTPTSAGHRPDDLSRRRADRRRRIALSVTSAAAAIILVVGGVVIGRSWDSSPAPTGPTVAQSNPLDDLRDVMSAQDAQMHRTKMTGMEGTVVVASSRSLDTAVVLLDGAAQPPAVHTYQLWLIGNNHPPKSAGLVNGATTDPVIITGLSGSRTVGMTVEPVGGSVQPTGEVLAAVTI